MPLIGYELGTVVDAIERVSTANVTALTVEATEFPELLRRHGVSGVPRIVVNRGGALVGATPEDGFVGEVVRLAGQAA